VTINPAVVTIACRLLFRQSGRDFALIGWTCQWLTCCIRT